MHVISKSASKLEQLKTCRVLDSFSIVLIDVQLCSGQDYSDGEFQTFQSKMVAISILYTLFIITIIA